MSASQLSSSTVSGSLRDLATRLQNAYGVDTSRRSDLPSAIDDGSSISDVSMLGDRKRPQTTVVDAVKGNATRADVVPRRLPFQTETSQQRPERRDTALDEGSHLASRPIGSATGTRPSFRATVSAFASATPAKRSAPLQGPALTGLRKFQSPPLLPSTRSPDSPDSEDTHVEAQALWQAFSVGIFSASPSLSPLKADHYAGAGTASSKLRRKDGTLVGSPPKSAPVPVIESDSSEDEQRPHASALRRPSVHSLATTASNVSAHRAFKYVNRPQQELKVVQSPEQWPLRVLTEGSSSRSTFSATQPSAIQEKRPVAVETRTHASKPPSGSRPRSASVSSSAKDADELSMVRERASSAVAYRHEQSTRAAPSSSSSSARRRSVSPTRYTMSESQYKTWMSDRVRRPVTDSSAFLGRLMPAHGHGPRMSFLVPKHKSHEQFLAQAEEAVLRRQPQRGLTAAEHYKERIAVNVPPLLVPSECRLLSEAVHGQSTLISPGFTRVNLHVSRAHLLAESSTAVKARQEDRISTSCSLVPHLWRFLHSIRSGGRALDLEAAQQSCAVRLYEHHVKRRVFSRLTGRMQSRQAGEVTYLRQKTWTKARALSAWKKACAVVAARQQAAVNLLKKVRLRRQARVFYAWAGHTVMATHLRLRTAAYQAHRLCRALAVWRTHCFVLNRGRVLRAWTLARTKHRVFQGLYEVKQAAKSRREQAEANFMARRNAILRSVVTGWRTLVATHSALIDGHLNQITVPRRQREAVAALRVHARQTIKARQTYLQASYRLACLRAKRAVLRWRSWMISRGRSRAVKAHVYAWHRAKAQEKVLYGWRALVLRRDAAELHLQERASAHHLRHQLRAGVVAFHAHLRRKQAARRKATSLLQRVTRHLLYGRIITVLQMNVSQERAHEQALAHAASSYHRRRAVGKVLRLMAAHASRRIAARRMVARAADKWKVDAMQGTVRFWRSLTRRRRHLRAARGHVEELHRENRKAATLHTWMLQWSRRQRLKYAYNQLFRVISMLRTAKQFHKWRVHTRKIRVGASRLVAALGAQHRRVRAQAWKTWAVYARIATLRLQALKAIVDDRKQQQLTSEIARWRLLACTRARLQRAEVTLVRKQRARALHTVWTRWASAYDVESRVRRLVYVAEQYCVQRSLRSAVTRLRLFAMLARQRRAWRSTAQAHAQQKAKARALRSWASYTDEHRIMRAADVKASNHYCRSVQYRVLTALLEAIHRSAVKEKGLQSIEQVVAARKLKHVRLRCLHEWKASALQKRAAKRQAAATLVRLSARGTRRVYLLHWNAVLPLLRQEETAQKQAEELARQADALAKAEASHRHLRLLVLYRVWDGWAQHTKEEIAREHRLSDTAAAWHAQQTSKMACVWLQQWKRVACVQRRARRTALHRLHIAFTRACTRTAFAQLKGATAILTAQHKAALEAKQQAEQLALEEQQTMMEQERLAAERHEARAVACQSVLRRVLRLLALGAWRAHARTKLQTCTRASVLTALVRQRALQTSLRLWYATLVERIQQASAAALVRQAQLRHAFDRLHVHARHRKSKARRLLVLKLALQEGPQRTYVWSCALLDCLPQQRHAVLQADEEEEGEIVGFSQEDTVLHSTALIGRIWAKLKAGAQASRIARLLWARFIDAVRNDLTLVSKHRLRETVRKWHATVLPRRQLAAANALAERLAARRALRGAGYVLRTWRTIAADRRTESALQLRADGHLFLTRAYKGLAAFQEAVNAARIRQAAASVLAERLELRLKIRAFLAWKQRAQHAVQYKQSLLQHMSASQQETSRTPDHSAMSSSTLGFASPGRRLLRESLATRITAPTPSSVSTERRMFQFTDLR